MPDVWATVAELDPTTQERMADVLETRGADPRQQEMRQTFLADIAFPAGAEVLEVGCGTGVLTRALAGLPAIDRVVGVDIAESLLDRARELAPDLEFAQADAVAEAFRVLRPDGLLAAFDGDYATATVALAEHDPLQTCVAAMMANSVTDRRIMRRLPALLRQMGFELGRTRSHGFVETGDGGYMLTVIDRGADMLSGTIGDELAAALKAEARRRAAAGGFFGHIAYASVIARKAR
jgi:SAM-dependent methyltransferase